MASSGNKDKKTGSASEHWLKPVSGNALPRPIFRLPEASRVFSLILPEASRVFSLILPEASITLVLRLPEASITLVLRLPEASRVFSLKAAGGLPCL